VIYISMVYEHEEGSYGIGASKAQHFIEHLRSVDKSKDGWRDEQEKWAEQAQMGVCEELSCPVCMTTCKTLTQHHWDTNRILHGNAPVNEQYVGLSNALRNAVKAKGVLID